MKKAMFVVAILAAGAARAAVFQEGSYAGVATWRGSGGTSGDYTVEKSFSGNTIRARYAWSQPQPREERITLTFQPKGSEPLFDVVDDKGTVVGSGFCADDTCAYHLTHGPVVVDETFRFANGSVVSTGAKSGPGFSVVWKETLQPK